MNPNDPAHAVVRKVRPHQMAWLHRPELDMPGVEMWEKPNGDIHIHAIADGPLMLEVYRYRKNEEI